MSESTDFNWRRAILVAAGVVFLAGFLALLVPASVGPSASPVSCGSGFAPSDTASMRDAGSSVADAILGRATVDSHRYEDLCAAKLSQRRTIGWPLVIVGGAVLIGLAVASGRQNSPIENSA